jgi:hypothetical protein
MSTNGNGNGKAGREERLQVMLDPEELRALDDFRFQQRMPSRAAAVRELLRRGLAADGYLPADGGVKSSGFGVLSAHESDPEEPASDKGARSRRPRA